ncbi:hypothetical protein QMM42_10395 [Leptospira santarosai]|uniref:Putative lipoprotein n=2 Tax=Leptospira santarosai TaxID=28183 RepID=M6JZT6_9LEPT|nr:hypothetical protein [Leptospira santarosai]EMN20997.1 putative lipoprotein [Leptospira santarosai serovar Arenal str. MAVJ 401]MDI7186608.1 hypothetical protein [Leptospira santarosai]MDI7197616.1 hypothetical protein [Leptospira santarosai]MDI7200072.1 hypothetical protein [Leptospira santarosai]MDI7206180.1 hypothetical protein [Leptospira santarosai]
MKIRFVFFFLVLISLAACNEKKNEIDPDLLLSVALLQPPDRAENYDRDVQIITHTPQGFPVGCDIDYSDADVNFVAERFKRDIAKYPRGYFIKAGAERIVLCSKLTSFGAIQGAFSARDGIYSTVGNGDVLKYAPGRVTTYDGLTVQYSDLGNPIHHELTHSIDRSQGLTFYFDPDWEGLNYPGFQYGKHNTPQNTSLLHPLPGFVAIYGTTNHLEDKATIGAFVMGAQIFYSQLVKTCQNDPIVAAKVRKLVSRWKQFWPFPGAENTEWKARITQAERDCG